MLTEGQDVDLARELVQVLLALALDDLSGGKPSVSSVPRLPNSQNVKNYFNHEKRVYWAADGDKEDSVATAHFRCSI